MRYYELTYLISGKLSDKEIKTLEEKITSLIEEEKGILFKLGEATKTKLAYQINKEEWAYQNSLVFLMNPENIQNFEKKLKNKKEILRYLILTKKVPRKTEKLGTPLKTIKKTVVLPKEAKKEKQKVELKEIDKKLEEILGEI